MASPMMALESALGSALDPGVDAVAESLLEAPPNPGVQATLESALDSALDRSGDAGLPLQEDHALSLGLGELDRKLFALCRERGPLRAVLARIASRLVLVRAWERIGYARLSDYAVERLGTSARSVRSLAEVGTTFGERPLVEEALVAGTLGWTKVRLLARLPRGEDEGRWIEYARRVTAEKLSRAVRAVDRGSLEAGGAEEAGDRSRLFEVRCTPEVRWKWLVARRAAARAAGRVLHVSEAAELIAAEVLSALPIDQRAEDGACEEAAVSWGGENQSAAERGREPAPLREAAPDLAPDPARSELCEAQSVRGEGATTHTGPPSRGEGVEGDGGDPARPTLRPLRRSLPPSLPSRLPPALAPFLEGLDQVDAFEIDDRFRRALALEQRLEARIGPLLALVWGRFVHRALGHPSRDAYARERLGMDPTRARALVRLERAAVQSRPFARAYRTGALSWVKAGVLAPLVTADPLGWFVEDWVAWARRVTVRRLSEDVEQALALAETDAEAFRRSGGLPSEAHHGREIGAARRGPGENMVARDGREIGAPRRNPEEDMVARDDRETGAAMRADELWLNRHPQPLKSAPDEICWARFFGPADVVQLFRAVLCTVRRRMEKHRERLPTAGEALGAMLDHVLSSWGALDATLAARHRVFARDGWRCAVPGCTSMQNLHDHHIRFRSAGGEDIPENRITLCAFHHLRGVHAGLLRCLGRAPDGLRWEIGIRPGVTPLLAYRSGDLRVRSTAAV